MRLAIRSNFLIWPYFAMLFIGLTFPSIAYRGILNPKSLIFILSVGSIGALALFKQSLRLRQLNVALFTLLSLSFLFLWLLIGMLQDDFSLKIRLDQFKLFVITITVPILTLYLVNEKKIRPSSVFNTVIYANLAYCTLKVGVVALHLLGVINMWEHLDLVGIRVMKTNIFGELSRLQSSVDISTPFVLYFVLMSDSIGKKTKAFYIVVSLFSNFLAFSRFLLAVYAASIALYFFTLNLSKVMKGIVLGSMVCFLALSFLGFENVTHALEKRFFSKESFLSDKTRSVQIEALIEEHESSPYLGKGLGGYSEKVIRDRQNKHSYEVQWIAFLMQFGLFGLLILLVPIGIIAFKLMKPPITRNKFSYLSLFGLWLISGFTNPFLISLQSGILYTLFLISSSRIAEEAEPSP